MLKLKANPTFKAKVAVPVPGGTPVEIVCEFRHRTRDQLAAMVETGKGDDARPPASAGDMLNDLVVGWEGVDAAFSREALTELCQQYHGAARAMLDAFASELTAARLGN